jgi:hypothetical protein
MTDWHTPTPTLLVKLGSIARHAEEAIGPTGHQADWQAISALLGDAEVSEWMAQLDRYALLPVPR